MVGAALVAALGLAATACGPAPGVRRSSHAAAFLPVSFTASGGLSFWLMGRGTCQGTPCLTVLRTSNAGRSFAKMAAPALPVKRTQPTPVLRFANARDGYAFVPGAAGSLYATHDGGRLWRRVGLGALSAVASAGGEVYALGGGGCGGSCPRLWRSSTASNSWTSSSLPSLSSGPGLALAALGNQVWVIGTGAGATAGAELAHSTDRGAAFEVGPGPCVPGLGGQIQAAAPQVIWAVCPTGMLAQALRSVDAGSSFQVLATGELANGAELAAASGDDAVLAPNQGMTALLRTADGGRSWSRAKTPGGAGEVIALDFASSSEAAALISSASGRTRLWLSRDGGAVWSVVPVP